MTLIDFIFFGLLFVSPLSVYYVLLSKGFLFVLISCLIAWLYIDFFSGILHIVFDNKNINIPYFSSLDNSVKEIAYNFQHHHKNTSLIYTKSSIEILKEIKYLIFVYLIIPIWICIFGAFNADVFSLSNDYFILLHISQILIMFGALTQLSHRNSHMPQTQKIKLFVYLENLGIIMSNKYHHQHHINYDKNFPTLSGKTGSLVNYLYKKIKNERFFQILFILLGIFGSNICLLFAEFLYKKIAL